MRNGNFLPKLWSSGKIGRNLQRWSRHRLRVGRRRSTVLVSEIIISIRPAKVTFTETHTRSEISSKSKVIGVDWLAEDVSGSKGVFVTAISYLTSTTDLRSFGLAMTLFLTGWSASFQTLAAAPAEAWQSVSPIIVRKLELESNNSKKARIEV